MISKNLKLALGDIMEKAMKEKIEKWLQEPFDQTTQLAIRNLLLEDPKKLEDCFSTNLSFGTGGLRALMDVGTNRLNIYTIRRTTQGLANYLKSQFQDKPISVVIGFDSRINSKKFAEEAAFVLIQNGISVFLIKELRPTPFISFACRHFEANAAIMITASHNPKEYNGYKVYWQDGAQVVYPHDLGILAKTAELSDFSVSLSEVKGILHEVDHSLDLCYLDAIRPLQNAPAANKEKGKDLKIAYTSLHGTGITLAPKALQDWGFSSLFFVEKQIIPDGNFPTVALPNPEYKTALEMGLELMKNISADILLATDPDADRLGVAVLHHGEPLILTGNEIACICLEYLCQNHKISSKSAAVSTIVSTSLIHAICNFHQIEYVEVLTGFKYIGEKIHEWEKKQGAPSFLFGAEESYGYLYGTHARDKDAIVCCCLIAEIALKLKSQGKTIADFLYEIYKTYGIFRAGQVSIECEPTQAGADIILNIMNSLRKNPPKEILGIKIIKTEDFLMENITKLPAADVLLFRLEDGSKLVIRPSGTEQKLKVYGEVRQTSYESLKEGVLLADTKLSNLLSEIKKELLQD